MGLTAEETSSRGISVAHGGLLAGSLGPLDAESGVALESRYPPLQEIEGGSSVDGIPLR